MKDEQNVDGAELAAVVNDTTAVSPERQAHTPGPWSLPHFADTSCDCPCAYVLSNNHFGAIATVQIDNGKPIESGGNDSPKLAAAIANAHLIAAAPDLLEALKQLKSRIEELSAVKREGVTGEAYDVMTSSIGDDITAEFLEAEEAIAKAEGRS